MPITSIPPRMTATTATRTTPRAVPTTTPTTNTRRTITNRLSRRPITSTCHDAHRRATGVRVLPPGPDRVRAGGRAVRNAWGVHRAAPDELHRPRPVALGLRGRRGRVRARAQLLPGGRALGLPLRAGDQRDGSSPADRGGRSDRDRH